MKLGKSKLALAKVINENGGWPQDSELVVQNGEHGRISFSINKPVRHDSKSWIANGGFNFKIEVCKPLKNWHQNVLSREEYYHAYPKADADGWIEWKGGMKSPVESGAPVDVKTKDGYVHYDQLLGDACWRDNWGDANIISYRLHKPEVKPEFCESVVRSIPEPDEQVWTNPPSIEQMAADYHNAKDYAERKQQEADDAKADAGAKLKALELAGEVIGLIVSPITEKQEPGLVITDWRDLQVGDEIATNSMGKPLIVTSLRCHDDSWPIDAIDGDGITWSVSLHDWRFIRRP